MKLWEGLEQDLNYNAMVSQRGVLNSITPTLNATPTPAAAMHAHARRRCRTSRCAAVRRMLPVSRFRECAFSDPRGLLQRRGGTARHDAVVWGYARGGERPRRRHHSELRSDGLRPRHRTDRGRRDHARHNPGKEDRHGRRRQYVAGRRHGRPPTADRKPRAAGFRLRGHQAIHPRRRHLRRGTLLYQPVGQRRTGFRRRSSTATTPMRSAATCRRWRMSAKAAWR